MDFKIILKKIGSLAIKIFVVFFISYLIFIILSGINLLNINIDTNEYKYMSKNEEYFNRRKITYSTSVICNKNIHGFHYTPEKTTEKGIAIIIGDNNMDTLEDRALECLNAGIETYTILYYGYSHQPNEIRQIPVEYFGEFLNAIKNESENTSPITLIGFNQGAEYALLLTQYYNEIDNLVLFSPTNYITQSDMDKNSSKWTYNGENLPYINFDNASFYEKSKQFIAINTYMNLSYKGLLNSAIKNTPNAINSKLTANNISGNLLLFAGDDDKYIGSDKMAMEIYNDFNNKEKSDIHIFSNVGYDFLKGKSLYGYKLGGNYNNNLDAYNKSSKILIDFLKENH